MTSKSTLSMTKILGMIFIPSLVAMGVYIGLTLKFHRVLPSLFLFFIAAILILFPAQLYFILRDSKQTFGHYGMKSAFLEHKQYSKGLVLLLGLLCFGFAGLMTITLMPFEGWLFSSIASNVYERIPTYFNWSQLDYLKRYSKSVLIMTGVFYIVVNGFIGPIVEELFFRGYLTHKLKHFGVLAPIVMTVLFSLYHFWLPFDNVFRIIAFFPAFYLAWRMKNIYIAIIFHCASNIFTSVMFFVYIMSIV